MIDIVDFLMEEVNLEYYNGVKWVYVGHFPNEKIAWMSLGNDNINYRTVDNDTGSVIRENLE